MAVRVLGQSRDKREIAYLLLKEDIKSQFQLIQDKIVSSLSDCGIETEEIISFSATLMREALKDILGEN